MSIHPKRNRNRGDAGFTVIELLMVSVVGLILVMAVYQILISQSRLLTQQSEGVDARGSSRMGATFLTWELKNAAASGSDLYAIGQNSVVLRSVQASGVICSWVVITGGSGDRRAFGLRNTTGTFAAGALDSAMVFQLSDHSWKSVKLEAAFNGPDSWVGGLTPVCFWGDSTTAVPRPEAAVHLRSLQIDDLLTVGAPVHVFRQTEYGLFERDGRWWLGRRIKAMGATWEPWEILAGPMFSPTDGGLSFAYYDASDAVTTDPTLVTRIEFTVRSQSFGQLSPGGQAGGYVEDSVTMTVSLRNNF